MEPVPELNTDAGSHWVAVSLYKAFCAAQKEAYEDLQVTAALKTMLP